MLPRHPRGRFRSRTAEVPYVAPSVGLSVGVDDLTVEAGLGHAEPIVVTDDRRRIDNERDQFALARFPHEGHNAVVGIVKINPLETGVTVILIPERRFVSVNVV